MQRRLNLTRWRCAVLLAHLVRQAEPQSMVAMGAHLGLDHTTLWDLLTRLQKAGAVDRIQVAGLDELAAATSRRVPRALYGATAAARMAAGASHGM